MTGEAVGSLLVLLSVARSLDDDDFGAMEQAIEQCRGEHAVVVERLAPLFELAVGGEDGRGALTALRDHLKETVGALLIDR